MNYIMFLSTHKYYYYRKEMSKLYLPPYYTLTKCYEMYKQLSENLVCSIMYNGSKHNNI